MDRNRTVHWKDSVRLHVPLYNPYSLKTAPLDMNIFQKVEKNSSTTEIQVSFLKKLIVRMKDDHCVFLIYYFYIIAKMETWDAVAYLLL